MYRSFFQFVKPYRKEAVLAPLFKMLEALFELFVPLVVASIIDRGIEKHDIRHIVMMVLILLLLAGIGLVCSITAQYFSARAAVGSASDIRRKLFSHIQGFDYAQMDDFGPATLITRLTNDVNQVQNGINLTLRLFLRSPFIVFGSMIMAFTIDRRIALLFALVIFLLFVVVFGIMFVTRPIYKKVQIKLDRLLNTTRENLAGVRVIRAFRLEEREKLKFHSENERLTREQKKAGLISGLTNPLTFIIINLSILLLIYQGGIRVNEGSLTVGQLVALYNYMSQILIELIKLANLIISMTRAAACYDRIHDVFLVIPQMKEGTVSEIDPEEECCVSFEHVSFSYHEEGEAVLNDISFTVRKGEIIGIIGGTGSGKSTLINLIPRFYDAGSGRVSVFGRDVRSYCYETLRSRIGLVPQKAQLFSGTIRENLAMAHSGLDGESPDMALKASQSEEFIAKMPEGIDSVLEQGGRNLSGGQRQRLTIARALSRHPDILILDDAASALDYATEARLRKEIKELENNPTVFIVSQRTSSVRFADRILVLDDGRLAGNGTHESLMEECSIYREIYDSQFRREGSE